jgi:hypothetical protein
MPSLLLAESRHLRSPRLAPLRGESGKLRRGIEVDDDARIFRGQDPQLVAMALDDAARADVPVQSQ